MSMLKFVKKEENFEKNIAEKCTGSKHFYRYTKTKMKNKVGIPGIKII